MTLINVSKGQPLSFQIDGVTHSGVILKTSPDPMLADRTICVVPATFDIRVGSKIFMPHIPESGTCGVIRQVMADEGGVAVSVPNFAIDPRE